MKLITLIYLIINLTFLSHGKTNSDNFNSSDNVVNTGNKVDEGKKVTERKYVEKTLNKISLGHLKYNITGFPDLKDYPSFSITLKESAKVLGINLPIESILEINKCADRSPNPKKTERDFLDCLTRIEVPTRKLIEYQGFKCTAIDLAYNNLSGCKLGVDLKMSNYEIPKDSIILFDTSKIVKNKAVPSILLSLSKSIHVMDQFFDQKTFTARIIREDNLILDGAGVYADKLLQQSGGVLY